MMLKVSGLAKSFAVPESTEHLAVLNDVSFQVEAGETVAIMGPSGGGKSTLLSLIAGLDRSERGTVAVMGRDLSTFAASDLNAFRAQTIGIVFQQFQLLEHFSALENVRLPLDLRGGDARDADRVAMEKLSRVGLRERAKHFPHQMSRGECQRVAIARVLAVGAKLILADEPTGSLDAASGRTVMDLLFATAKESGASVVLVTHDAELARRCDRCLMLENGRLTTVAGRRAGEAPT